MFDSSLRTQALSAVLLVLLFLCEQGAALQVGRPASLAQCGISQLNWSGASGQIDVSVVFASNDSLIRTFDRQPAGTESLTWAPVNVTAGTSVIVKVVDSSGTVAESPVLTVTSSSDSDCISNVAQQTLSSTNSATDTGSSLSSSTSTSTTPSSSAAVTTSPPSSMTPSSSSGASTSSRAPTTTSPPSNSAGPLRGRLVFMCLFSSSISTFLILTLSTIM